MYSLGLCEQDKIKKVKIFLQLTKEDFGMFLILFALLMVIPWVLSDKVSTKPGLKMFRDEYKSIKETCLDLGFVKKPCNSGSGIICQFFYIVSEKPDGVIV